MEEGKSKNSVLRGKCCQYLQCVLKNYPKGILEKFIDDIEEMMTILLNEAAAETRVIARECYLKYESSFPDNAKNLLKKLPSPTQKAILEQSKMPIEDRCIVERPGIRSPQIFGNERAKIEFGSISSSHSLSNRTSCSSSNYKEK